jgi:hypothetical protein
MPVKVYFDVKQSLWSYLHYYVQAKIWIPCLLIMVTLACATNTPVAQVSTARPTRTPIPTFTNTPIPLTATPTSTQTDTPTPTDTPLFTNTPLPTDTPLFTDTPIPTDAPTDTPVPPTNTAVPATNTPLPTNTPPPTPVPAPVPVSPLATPTWTPVPASPPGTYSPKNKSTKGNCAHVGLTGIVRDGDDDGDPPIPNVTIIVTGDDDEHGGPFFASTASDGRYSLVVGDYRAVGRIELQAEIWGSNVKTDDIPKWKTTDHCDRDDSVQIMELDWAKRR